MKKCYIYTRVSTLAQTEGYSLEAQEECLREYAKYREFQIVGNYCDAGKSGKSIKGRPAFKQMMSDIMDQKDDVSFVLVFKLSRFGRNAADILKSLQLLEDFGVDLVSVDEAIDFSTSGGRLTLAILSAVAEMERENITVQFMAGKQQKIMDGGWSGGQVPYGYKSVDRELTIVLEEANIIRKIFELYLCEDMTASSVVHELNKNGRSKKCADGQTKPFTYDFVSRVLDNAFYCGRGYYNRRTNKEDRDGNTIKPDADKIIVAVGQHETIISEEIWELAQAKRKTIAEHYRKSAENVHTHILSGIVKCPICGKGLTGSISRTKSIKGDGYYKPIYYYTCRYNTRQNGHTCSFDKRLNQEIVDGIVLRIFDKLQTYKEFENAVQRAFGDQGDIDAAEKKLIDTRKELRDAEFLKDKLGETLDGLNPLSKDYDQKYDQISSKLDAAYDKVDELEKELTLAKKRFDSLKKKTDSAVQVKSFLENFRLMYDEMTEDERKEMYQSFVDSIELFPEERVDGKIVKSISFKFPTAFEGTPANKQHSKEVICFTIDCTAINVELSANGNIIMKKQADGSNKVIVRKGTYAAIKEYILEKYGTKVSTLYIAQIKRKYGLEIGVAYNKPEQNNVNVNTHVYKKWNILMYNRECK